jgi:hypothetical protein
MEPGGRRDDHGASLRREHLDGVGHVLLVARPEPADDDVGLGAVHGDGDGDVRLDLRRRHDVLEPTVLRAGIQLPQPHVHLVGRYEPEG